MLPLLKKVLKTERIAIDVIVIFLFKKFYHSPLLHPFNKKESKILLIVGCQRSGTSLMNRIFTRNFNVSVYRESSKLSSKSSDKLRINSFKEVNSTLSKNRAYLIVIKPLVESQNIPELLGKIPNSKALWMYRNYQDVARSSVKRFGNNRAIVDLKPIVENDKQNWRSEKASDYVRSIVTKYFSKDMSPHDAAALFWVARNQLFYELNLDENSQVFICRYEDLVTHPLKMMNDIYQFVNINFRNIKKIEEVHSQSVGQGKDIELSPSIEKLCSDLLEKLDRTYFLQQKSASNFITSVQN